MNRLALIAGSGALPAALVAALPERPFICALDGFAPEGLAVDQVFRVERLAPFLRLLEDRGITEVIFAGAVQRPRLDPSLFDPQTATLVPRLLAAMGQGDDATLRVVIALFEDSGFAVRGVEEIAPSLLPNAGLLAGVLTPQDEADADRAAAIVVALGAVDVGQGAVVAGGICLGVEVISGTDALLASVAALPPALRPARGVFYKAPKPAQDRRIDLPTIGVQTIRNAADAGLSGVVIAAGGVICLDLPAMIAEARAKNIFLWARD